MLNHRFFYIKPIKFKIARLFLLIGMALSLISAITNYYSHEYGYAIGAMFTVVITPIVLYLSRYERFHYLPLIVALLIQISFQFPGAFYSLANGELIFWFIAGPVFFFGLSNLYIGAALSLALFVTLVGNYSYSYLINDLVILRADIFFSLMTCYLFVCMLLWINERDRVGEEIKLSKSANIDYLTNIRNRRGMTQSLKEGHSLLNRYGIPVSLILFDLDNFKQVNDTYGHDTGDDVLVNMAKISIDNLRDSDTIGRWGGEEFLIMTPGLKIEDASLLAEKLRTVMNHFQHPDVGSVSASFGVSMMRKDEDLTMLMQRIDDLLYEAKRSKNCVKAAP